MRKAMAGATIQKPIRLLTEDFKRRALHTGVLRSLKYLPLVRCFGAG